MINVFEIILCMYLKTISPDVPRFTFVCSIYNWPISKNILGRLYWSVHAVIARYKLLFPRKYLIFSYYEWYYGLRFENGIEDQPSKVGIIFIVWRKWKLVPVLSECASWDSIKVELLIACLMFNAKYNRQFEEDQTIQ